MTKKRRQQIEKIISGIIDKKFEEACQKICTDKYYKFQFLDYSIRNNTSVQCIGRTFAEMQKTYYQQFSHDASDLKQINQTVSYLNLYSDDETLDFIANIFSKLKSAIYAEFDYIMITLEGRFKSFRSHFVKVISKIIMDKVLKVVKKHLTDYPEITEFSEEELQYIQNFLDDLLAENNKKNPSKDCLGYRFIVDAVNYSTEEESLIDFIYKLLEFCKEFFSEQGYDIVEIKDYINSPKDNGYQSLHIVVDILGLPVEIQFRTGKMHKIAEEGSASHKLVYKDTLLQNFVSDFMYDVSLEIDREDMNERIGLLVSQNIPKSSICRTPHSEVPATPALLKNFDNMRLLKKIYDNSPRL